MYRYSNKDYCQTFTIFRTMTSSFSRMEHRHTIHATLSLTCTPMWRSSLNRKTGPQIAWIIPVWAELQQMVYCDKISDIGWNERMLIDCWTEWSISCQKRLTIVIKMKGAQNCPCWISSGLHVIVYSNGHCYYFHCRFTLKMGKIYVFLSKSA